MKMAMTVNKLYKQLDQLIKDGHGRKHVCIDKETFYSLLEDDGATIINVEKINGPLWIETIDDDGYAKENKYGSVAGMFVVVLSGE
jgi:hypothetical protein